MLSIRSNFKHSGPESWSVEQSNKTWIFDKQQAGVGVLADLVSHKLDIIRYITGLEIEKLISMTDTLDKRYEDGSFINLEDNAVCMFRLSDGTPGVMDVSWTNYGEEDNSTVIYGTRGVMKIFGSQDADILLEMSDHTSIRYSIGGIQTNANQTKSGIIDEFVSAVLEKREPIVTGIDGHNTLAVIMAALESSKSHEWVKIDYDIACS